MGLCLGKGKSCRRVKPPTLSYQLRDYKKKKLLQVGQDIVIFFTFKDVYCNIVIVKKEGNLWINEDNFMQPFKRWHSCH